MQERAKDASTQQLVQIWKYLDEDSKRRLYYSAIIFDKRIRRILAVIGIVVFLVGLKIITTL